MRFEFLVRRRLLYIVDDNYIHRLSTALNHDLNPTLSAIRLGSISVHLRTHQVGITG